MKQALRGDCSALLDPGVSHLIAVAMWDSVLSQYQPSQQYEYRSNLELLSLLDGLIAQCKEQFIVYGESHGSGLKSLSSMWKFFKCLLNWLWWLIVDCIRLLLLIVLGYRCNMVGRRNKWHHQRLSSQLDFALFSKNSYFKEGMEMQESYSGWGLSV